METANRPTNPDDVLEVPRRRRREAYHTSPQLLDRAVLEAAAMKPIQRELQPIRESVRAASADELIAAGWGEYARWRIPADWRTRRPRVKFGMERSA